MEDMVKDIMGSIQRKIGSWTTVAWCFFTHRLPSRLCSSTWRDNEAAGAIVSPPSRWVATSSALAVAEASATAVVSNHIDIVSSIVGAVVGLCT